MFESGIFKFSHTCPKIAFLFINSLYVETSFEFIVKSVALIAPSPVCPDEELCANTNDVVDVYSGLTKKI